MTEDRVKHWENKDTSSEGYFFYCPGCNDIHQVITKGNKTWSYNGDPAKPTFSPSILTQSGYYTPFYRKGDSCWCDWAKYHPDEEDSFRCNNCHSFIHDGKIQFLNDCSHEFAGQTVEMKPVSEWDSR